VTDILPIGFDSSVTAGGVKALMRMAPARKIGSAFIGLPPSLDCFVSMEASPHGKNVA
jgi:hypothetical protein